MQGYLYRRRSNRTWLTRESRAPSAERCPRLSPCGSWQWEWTQSTGRGTVFTWTVATCAMHPAFQADVPHAVVVIEMTEGVRVLSQVVDCLPDELAIGMPVEVVFDEVTPDIALPRFRRDRKE